MRDCGRVHTLRIPLLALAVSLLAVTCEADDAVDVAEATEIQQPGEFRVEIPANWAITLPVPFDVWQEMERQDPGSTAGLPLFTAVSGRASDAETAQNAVFLAVFKIDRDGTDLSDVANRWAEERIDDADLGVFESVLSRRQTVVTAAGTVRQRAEEGRAAVTLSLIVDRDRDTEAWILLCVAQPSASDSLMSECSDILLRFEILSVLDTS